MALESLTLVARPSGARIAAASASLALNLTALLLVMIPFQMERLPHRATDTPLAISLLTPAPPEIPTPPLPALPTPSTPTTPHVTHAVAVAAHPQPTHSSEATAPAVVDVPATTTPTLATPTPPETGPVMEAHLNYRAAPAPAYPVTALRQQAEGTVLLRVHVDPSGKPIEVVVEHSSGHLDLDRVARAQVLEHWLFEPASRNGQAVDAWALVPVAFQLH